MHTSTLCLGALSLGEGSGYDIKKIFEAAFTHFQNASYGSIYPALRRLEEAGEVECRIESGTRHPDRKLFSLTGHGREKLIQTLIATPANELLRSDFLVLMFFAHLLPTEVLATKIDEMTKHYRDELDYLQSIIDQPCLTPGMRFTIEQGINTCSINLDHLHSRREVLLATHQQIPTNPESLSCADT